MALLRLVHVYEQQVREDESEPWSNVRAIGKPRDGDTGTVVDARHKSGGYAGSDAGYLLVSLDRLGAIVRVEAWLVEPLSLLELIAEAAQ